MADTKLLTRVSETTTSTGTVTLDLAGAQTGYRAFLDEASSGDEVWYLLVDDPNSPTFYECGRGTITSGTPNTLSRDEVVASSNADSKVSLPVGTTIVSSSPPKEFLDRIGRVMFMEVASAPTTAANQGAVYVKEVSGNTELFFGQEGAGAEVQITSGGSVVGDTSFPLGYRFGGILSNGTDADHDIDVTAGEFRGKDDDEDITLSAITKRIDASWSAGTNNGGLSSSLSLTADTWYHVHAIMVSGSADVGFDTSITAANLVTDHSATAYRRLGAVLTDGSSNIIAFRQDGDIFTWDDAPIDVIVTNQGTTPISYTLSTPLGVKCEARFCAYGSKASSVVIINYFDPDVSNPYNGSVGPLVANTDDWATTDGRCITNTSSQISADGNVSGLYFRIQTYGWRELLGD